MEALLHGDGDMLTVLADRNADVASEPAEAVLVELGLTHDADAAVDELGDALEQRSVKLPRDRTLNHHVLLQAEQASIGLVLRLEFSQRDVDLGDVQPNLAHHGPQLLSGQSLSRAGRRGPLRDLAHDQRGFFSRVSSLVVAHLPEAKTRHYRSYSQIGQILLDANAEDRGARSPLPSRDDSVVRCLGMKGRIVAAAVGLAAGWATACGTPSAFACTDDAGCVLGTQDGVCHTDGHCVYPDTQCESGFAYPVGASDVGGECATDVSAPATGTSAGPSATSNDAGADAGDTPSADDGDTTVGVSGADTGSSSTGDTAASSSGDEASTTDASGSSSDGPPPACIDDVGNDFADAMVIAGCATEFSGTIVDDTDIDVFSFDICAPAPFEAEVTTRDLIVCIFADCGDDSSNVDCGTDDEFSILGLDGCCDTGSVTASIWCQGFEDVHPIVTVTGADDAGECTEYDLVFGLD